jgi:hypothetical protein
MNAASELREGVALSIDKRSLFIASSNPRKDSKAGAFPRQFS